MLKEEEKQELQAYQAKSVMLDEKKDMDTKLLMKCSKN